MDYLFIMDEHKSRKILTCWQWELKPSAWRPKIAVYSSRLKVASGAHFALDLWQLKLSRFLELTATQFPMKMMTGDVDDGSLWEPFDGWGLMWLVLNCARLHVFWRTVEDRQYLRLNSRGVTGDPHVKTHYWLVVVHRCYPLPDQQCSLGLFRSLSPLRTRVQLPHAGLLYQCHPSLLIFSLSFSLINQCQAVQQQGQHSFPACLLSSSCMSLCVDPPPPSARAATIILSHGRRAEAPDPHCQHERFTGSVRGAKKKVRRQCSLFNLFFVWLREKKKGSLHHLHNSWNTQGEKMAHWVVKKKVWMV